MSVAKDARRAVAERLGRRAETLAALSLRFAGFSIVARRFKAAGGEIDLVGRRGGLLVFAEVKARQDPDAAVFAVDARTRRRVEAAARAFLSARPRLSMLGVRYDIVAISGWRVRRIADAWREGE